MHTVLLFYFEDGQGVVGIDHLDKSGSVISTNTQMFECQMAILLRAWNGKAALPVRPIVLTFDDALANFFDSAAPVLNDLGFTATIFAVAGYAGRTNEWPGHPAQIPRMPLLSWHDMRELTKQGFEIGCHTMTHIPLSGHSKRPVLTRTC